MIVNFPRLEPCCALPRAFLVRFVLLIAHLSRCHDYMHVVHCRKLLLGVHGCPKYILLTCINNELKPKPVIYFDKRSNCKRLRGFQNPR